MVDVIREEDGGEGGCEVWECSGQSEVKGLAGNLVECECLFDGFLRNC